ncbi:MAG TPA: protein-glutamate O-methyltransferase CheR [Gemmatimonadaceae bacterium]|nr:protein-glutamate O-methyltransferase CheR [Gemmatimonadaceae bacterium]
MNNTADDAAFVALTSKISRERGFDASSYKDTCMRRRLAVRMRARGAGDYETYSRLLDSDPAEYEWLIAVLTVNVTKLYRNADTWNAVAHTVLPALWATSTSRINCWVAGCSSGEEAYTISALWLELMAAARETDSAARVRVTASDIDHDSLVAAEAGVYADESFAEAPAGFRERWFVKAAEPGRWTAGPDVRSLVRFERRDLLLDPPPPFGMQLITCRNVIIYFDRESQDALMKRFHDALVPGGYLVLGKVETLFGPSRALFETVDSRQRIYRRS